LRDGFYLLQSITLRPSVLIKSKIYKSNFSEVKIKEESLKDRVKRIHEGTSTKSFST